MNMFNSDLPEVASCFPSEPENLDFLFDDKKLFYVLNITGTIWIRGTEITDILLYDNNREAISTYVDDGDFAYFHELKPKISGGSDQEIDHQNSVFLNQSGIYSLVLYSKLETVRCFISWFANVVVPSIEKLGDKFENESIAATNKAFEITKQENTNLKIQIQENMLMIDQQMKHTKMLQNLIWCLESESRAMNVAVAQQIHDEKVLQRQFMDLIVNNRVKNEQYENDMKKHENDRENMQDIIENLKNRITALEFENQSKDDLLNQKDDYMSEMNRKNRILELNIKNQSDQLDLNISGTEKIARQIQDLESRNQAKDEELERQINDMKKIQIRLSLLENENAELKIQGDLMAEKYTEILRTQDILLHLLIKNFVPKLYDRKLEEEFIVFRLNQENFFTHYAVRIRVRNISQQMKTIRARYPDSVELFRIACYPNTIHLLKLMRNHLKDKMQFKGNFFTVRSDEYTDRDLKNDVLKLFDEADSVRKDIFKIMDIERYFRTDENIYEITGCENRNGEDSTDQNQNQDSTGQVADSD